MIISHFCLHFFALLLKLRKLIDLSHRLLSWNSPHGFSWHCLLPSFTLLNLILILSLWAFNRSLNDFLNHAVKKFEVIFFIGIWFDSLHIISNKSANSNTGHRFSMLEHDKIILYFWVEIPFQTYKQQIKCLNAKLLKICLTHFMSIFKERPKKIFSRFIKQLHLVNIRALAKQRLNLISCKSEGLLFWFWFFRVHSRKDTLIIFQNW